MDEKVISAFREKFGQEPHFLVRAPGRVNLIGEHIDYNGFGVLPMALHQSVYCAVAAVPGFEKLQICNVDCDKYKDAEVVVDVNIYKIQELKTGGPAWYKYFLCGHCGMTDYLILNHLILPPIKTGMKIMIGGEVPAGSGLSSSSALVCAAVVSTLRVLKNKDFEFMDRLTVADIAAKCERHIGTEGGGMDQAICLLAEPDKATKIDFGPLKAKNIILPDGGAFVVANCCVESNKAASTYFNERVTECRLAAQILARKMGHPNWADVSNLGEVQKTLHKSIEDMSKFVDRFLTKSAYKKSEVAYLLQLLNEQLEIKFLSKLPKSAAPDFTFKLKQRAKHVFEEAVRVVKFYDTCAAVAPPPPPPAPPAAEETGGQGKPQESQGQPQESQGQPQESQGQAQGQAAAEGQAESREVQGEGGQQGESDEPAAKKRDVEEKEEPKQEPPPVVRDPEVQRSALIELGRLMDESHASCRDLYECSCPELDQLQQAAKQCGALGSRLTGAGWGGCTVSLVPADQVDHFMQQLRETYYANFPPDTFEKNVFSTVPSPGLEIKILKRK